MEEQANAGYVPAKWDSWEGKPGEGAALFAVVLLVLAGVFAGVGMYEAFTYDDSSHLVGGDAYNLQILASRGLVWMGGAAVLALGAVTHALFATRTAVLATVTARARADGTIRWEHRDQAQPQLAATQQSQ